MTSPNTFDYPSVRWRKASRSSGGGNECVEVATKSRVVAVRDSKNPAGPKLVFAKASVAAFVEGIKAGRYDL